jgi:hypothetical protein
LFLLRETWSWKELIRVKESLEGCIKEHKKQLEEFLQVYKGVFQELKWFPPKREGSGA